MSANTAKGAFPPSENLHLVTCSHCLWSFVRASSS